MTQEFDKMQTEDANDDSHIAAQDAIAALTRAQAKAIQAASTDPLPDLTMQTPISHIPPTQMITSKARGPK